MNLEYCEDALMLMDLFENIRITWTSHSALWAYREMDDIIDEYRGAWNGCRSWYEALDAPEGFYASNAGGMAFQLKETEEDVEGYFRDFYLAKTNIGCLTGDYPEYPYAS